MSTVGPGCRRARAARPGAARSARPIGRSRKKKRTQCWKRCCMPRRQTLTYVGDRPDVRDALDQLEAILRDVAEELVGWRTRAQKAEADLKARGTPVRNTELESENKALRQRVEGARTRVHDLMQRLTFLEEQARDNGGGGGGGGSGGSGGGAQR